MADATYQPKVYMADGGDRQVVASGGTLDIETGGALKRSGIPVDGGAPVVLGNVAVAADELVIPLTHAHVSKTTGADAEALTLADGSPAQEITITLVVDGGGTGTLTPATATGFVSIAFADAGDIATLRYVDDTVGWIIVGTAGVAGPPAIALT